jgi:light-regulated signal transduction histidine kinase (bacteriophytochrome)
VDEALEMLGLKRSEPVIDVRIPVPLPVIFCDRIRVREVLLNLIGNAVKYNDKAEKWVEIGWRRRQNDDGDRVRPDETVFYVRGNGIGIKPRFHKQIFEIFKRLHGQGAYGGGTGAGLTIARKIVERHGGHIWLESEVNRGTTFFFTLGGNAASRPQAG